jgi:hypothetical protein
MATCRGEKAFSILFAIFGFNSKGKEKEVRPPYACFQNETMGLNWAFNGPFLNTRRAFLDELLSQQFEAQFCFMATVEWFLSWKLRAYGYASNNFVQACKQ